MNENLDKADLVVMILESLTQVQMQIEHYDGYPSYEFKQKQLARVDSVLSKLKEGVASALNRSTLT